MTKKKNSLLGFDPFGLTTFGRSRKVAWLNHLNPIQVRGALNQKLGTQPLEVGNVGKYKH